MSDAESNHEPTDRSRSSEVATQPSHPALAAALLMIGVTFLLVALALVGVMS